MKKLIRTSLIAAVMLAASASYSNHDTSILNDKTMLSGKKVKRKQLVLIKDVNGHTVYSETIYNNGDNNFAFDLSTLKDGLYELEFNKDFEIQVESFIVKSHKVTFLEGTETTIFKPVVRIENGKVLISKLSFEDEPMTIKLYFENELVHSEDAQGNTIINRVFDLNEDIEGIYSIVIKTNGRVYRQSFKK